MRKRIKFILAGVLALAGMTTRADEGMWLPSLISQRITDMQEKGFRLDAEDIYSINEASLKDAVVLFGRGCTGELISPEGRMIVKKRTSSSEYSVLENGINQLFIKF